MSDIRSLILDMDGVIWRQNEPIGDLPAIFSEIRERGFDFCLATNNATLTVEGFVQKLAGMGVQVEADQVITSAECAAQYLKMRHPDGGRVFIVGEKGLQQALLSKGFQHADHDVLAVTAGMDREISYQKLARASQLIRQGAAFIGTNPDCTFPTPEGLFPGAGAILASLQAASGIDPIIVGKPAPEMYILALQRMQARPDETLVVGDRLETDIVGAQKIGCKTGVVLSGVCSLAEAESWQPRVDFIETNLAAMLSRMR